MIAVQLMSRLGNQMFELCTAYHLAKQYGQELALIEGNGDYERYPLILDGRKILQPNDVKDFHLIQEPKNQAMVDLSDVDKYDNVLLKGYFQSDKYFDRQDAEELFPIPQYIKDKYKYLEDYVCCSVRRTDYIMLKTLFLSPTFEWYKKCYEKHFDGNKVLVCSDDIVWCQNHFHFDNQEFLVNNDPIETLFIKAMCKNHIIAPSTFAWWSAYLANGKTIAPSDWVAEGLKRNKFNENDKYVEGWIKEPL